MSSDSLSQDEIDLLFNSGGDATPRPPAPDPAEDVQVYDFRRPARISKDRKRSLFAIYGLLAKSLEGWLAGRVRDSIVLELQSVEQLTFGEFTLALPSPCSSFIVDVGQTGSKHQGVIDFGHELAFYLIDRFLGGTGELTVPERALSPLERLVTQLVARRVAQQLGDVWKDYVKMDLEIGGFESIPEMLQVANREDPVLVANIRVELGQTRSLLLVCLPFVVLERFFTGNTNRRVQSAQGSEEERREDRRHVEMSLRDARAEIGARLPAFPVALRDLAALRPGQVLNTGLASDTDLEIHVSGHPRLKGAPGRLGRRMAVRVLDTIDSSKPEPNQETAGR
jgi:flagellar motor switch protein FliM